LFSPIIVAFFVVVVVVVVVVVSVVVVVVGVVEGVGVDVVMVATGSRQQTMGIPFTKLQVTISACLIVLFSRLFLSHWHSVNFLHIPGSPLLI
jgi:hypothetical protein